MFYNNPNENEKNNNNNSNNKKEDHNVTFKLCFHKYIMMDIVIVQLGPRFLLLNVLVLV